MQDIGHACGISAPSIYKHFAGKDAILTEALVAISDELLASGRHRARTASNPSAAIDALIGWHIEFALDNRAYIVAQEREWSNLDESGRASVRSRQLEYIDVWVDTVRQLR